MHLMPLIHLLQVVQIVWQTQFNWCQNIIFQRTHVPRCHCVELYHFEILEGDPYHWMEIFKLWLAWRSPAQCSRQRINKEQHLLLLSFSEAHRIFGFTLAGIHKFINSISFCSDPIQYRPMMHWLFEAFCCVLNRLYHSACIRWSAFWHRLESGSRATMRCHFLYRHICL